MVYDGNTVGYLTIGYYGPYALNDSELELINSLNRTLIGLGLIFTALAALLAILISRFFLRPISPFLLSRKQTGPKRQA